MRDLALFGVMLFMVPMALRNGLVAFLLWGYFSLLTPKFYLYGFMQNLRYAFFFAAIAIIYIAVKKIKNIGVMKWQSTNILLVLFLLHGAISSFMGIDPNPLNEDRLVFFAKGVTFCLLMPYFINTRWRVHALLVMIALGLGAHGVIEGLKYISSAGVHRVGGIPNSSLSDNNLFAVGMVMVIPIMIYLSQYSRNKLVAMGYAIAALLTVLCVLGTNSRGGFLGLAAVGGWLFLTTRKKFRAMLFIVAGCIVVYYFAPDVWFERMSTINSADEDASFMGRIAAWRISSAIALANPLFGGGFHAVEIQWIWDLYREAPNLLPFVPQQDIPLLAKASHSIYFQVLGDMGFIGMALFVAILTNAFWVARDIRCLAAKREEHEWLVDLAKLIMVSLVAYMVSGGGVGLAYYELSWILLSLLGIMRQILLQQDNNLKTA
jgi:probable O-glycosylation ligase (exosortase A-associated)